MHLQALNKWLWHRASLFVVKAVSSRHAEGQTGSLQFWESEVPVRMAGGLASEELDAYEGTLPCGTYVALAGRRNQQCCTACKWRSCSWQPARRTCSG